MTSIGWINLHKPLRKILDFAAIAVYVGILTLCPRSATADEKITKPIFEQLFVQIQEFHLNPPVSKQLFYYAVDIMQHIEPKLRTREAGHLLIYYDAKPILSYRVPDNNAARAWGQITQNMLIQLYANSRELQKLPIQERAGEIAATLMKALDQYSHVNLSALPDAKTGNLADLDEPQASIGISITTKRDGAFVSNILPNSPAKEQLQLGDRILAINGQPTERQRAKDLVQQLRGPAHSAVELRIDRDGRELAVVIARQALAAEKFSLRYDNQIALLRIEHFTPGLAEKIADNLWQNRAAFNRIVLDLRGSRGGVLEEATALADLFVASGQLVSMRGRHPDSSKQFSAQSGSDKLNQPMAVLIDGRTASAAEVLAAALQDHGRAVIIGTASYGKGAVQRASYIDGLGQVAITWAMLYKPASGGETSLHGVMPQICSAKTGIDENGGALPEPERLMIWMRRAPQVTWDAGNCNKAARSGKALDLQLAVATLADPGLYSKLLKNNRI
jgi:carboxyl-terminal processing protease